MLLLSAYFSVQAPTGIKRKAFEIDAPNHTSFSDLIKNRRTKKEPSALDDFKQVFAQHPEVKKLDSLTGEAFIKQAIALKLSIKDEDPVMKGKFRRAINDYMKDHNIDSQLQLDVKSRLTQVTKTQTSRKYTVKMLEQDPTAWKERRNRNRANLRIKEKERMAAMEGMKESSFEQRIKTLKLPENAKAADVERAVREANIVIDNPNYTTAELRRYLNERYGPEEVRNAMANRSYHLAILSRLNDHKINGQKRKMRKQSKGKRTNVESSASNRLDFHAPSSNNVNGEVDGHDIDPMGKHFHPTEWWEKMY